MFPTLAIGNYVDRMAPGAPWGTCADNYLDRPASSDKPDYSDPVALSPSYCSLSMLFTDWNQSGVPSLRVTNDRQYYRGGEEQMWHVDPGKPPRLYTASEGWQHLSIYGMGIAQANLYGNGYPVYALTSMGDTKLQELSEEADTDRPIYKDIAYPMGATAARPYIGGDVRPSTGWHSQFADFNNDGLLDLFIAKGNVDAMPDFAADDPDNLLLGQWDKTFTEVGKRAGIALPRKGRGGAADRPQHGRHARSRGGQPRGAGQPVPQYRHQDRLGRRRAARQLAGDRAGPADGQPQRRRRAHQRQDRQQRHGPHRPRRRRPRLRPFRLRPCRPRHGRARRDPRALAGRQWSGSYRVFANNFVRIERGKAEAEYWLPEPPPGN